jgi:ABC-type glycerol-3-phosphate transport system substrate-binding protein
MKKKMLVLMLIASMFSATVFANGSSESMSDSKTDKGPVKLSVFGFKTAVQAEIIEDLIAEFNEANPDIIVTYEGLTNTGGYENVLTTRLASGQGDDVFMSSTSFINKIEQSGYTLDLSDLPVLDNYAQNMKVGDTVPGLAMDTSMFGMYVNHDLLAKCGIDSVPQTKAEFLRDCQIIKDAGYTPIVAGASDGTGAGIFGITAGFEDLYLNSSPSDKAAGIKAIDNGDKLYGETIRKGLEFDEMLVNKGYIDGKKAIVMNPFSDGIAAFSKGDVAFFMMGSWSVSSIRSTMPDVKVTFEGIPDSDNGQIVLSDAGVRLCVNSSSKHQAEAIRFIEFMTRTDNNDRYCANQASFTVLKDGTSTQDEMVQPAAAILKSGRFIPWADTTYRNVDTWGLVKQYGANVFAGTPADTAIEDLDEANSLNLALR